MNLRQKNKKSKFIILGLLLICVTIGYAVLSVSDSISGVSKIKNANWDIHFENVVVNEDSVPIDGNSEDHGAVIDLEDTTKVSFAVTLDKPGDFYEFTVDAVNDGTIDGMIDNIVSKLNNQVIENLPNYLIYTITKSNGDPIEQNHLIPANSSETYKVRLEYSKDIEIEDIVGEDTSLSFDFTINYKQADSTATDLVNYTVTHRYKKLDNTYEEVTENLRGEAGSSVTPSLSPRTGFVSPNTQTVTIASDGSTAVTYNYDRETYHFAVTDRTYIDGASTADGDYPYETEVTVIALAREHYAFRWSDDDTNLSRTITLTDDVTLTPIYTQNAYTITFNPTDGECETTSKTVNVGSNIGELPEATYTGHYLDGWYTSLVSGEKVDENYIPVGDKELFAVWKVSVEAAVVENSSISVEVEGEETIVISNAASIEENYTFTSNDTNIATVDSTGKVTGVGTGTTTITITGVSSNKTKTVNVEVTAASGPTEYVVTLNGNGGEVSPTSINVTIGQAIGDIPTPVLENHIFAGWYTGVSTGIEVDSTYVPTGDIEIFARWNKIICKRATVQHTETCARTTDGCGAAGYTATGSKGTTTITYGNIPTGNFAVGNIYNCDVNNDGIYSDTNERFYYLAPRGDNAVLIFYSNFEGTNGIATSNIFDYDTALTKLPTTEQWSGLNVSFNGYAARFPYVSEIESACGITVGSSTTGELDSCVFLLENSRFVSSSTGRTATWLEKVNNTYYRIYTTNRNVATVQSSSNNVARPVIEVAVNYVDNSIDSSELATVTFDVDGGDPVHEMKILKNSAIGTLPTTSKLGFSFDGWYNDSSYSTQVTSSTIITQDVEFVAKWTGLEGAAAVNGVGYQSLAAAMNAVPNNTKTTVLLLQDGTETVSIDSTKDVVLDLGGHSITYDSETVVSNSGIVLIKNGTINSASSSGALTNNSSGTMYVEDLEVYSTGGKQAIYNNGGDLEIRDGCVLSSTSSNRASVHNLNSGSVDILGGEIVSTNYIGVYNEAGTLNIGTDDNYVDATTPVIQGATYGVSGQAFGFYDGIIKGATLAVEDETVMTIDSNSEPIHDTEVITQTTYNTLYLNMLVNKYRIVFHPNGGTVSPTSKLIDAGDRVGELPTPQKGIYTFDGWYTGLTNGVLIDENEIPSGSVTYYARWSYTASNVPVSFDMVNDPMKVYYNNIGTWKNDESNFQTVMKANFDNYHCSCTDNTCTSTGNVYCDKPNAFDTTLQEPLNVYLYDSVNNTKGTQVNYTNSSNGIIYNMIPGVTYYWELVSDTNVYGLVTPTA